VKKNKKQSGDMEDTHKFGGKTKVIIAFIAGFVGFQLLFHLVIYPKDRTAPESVTTECKADSLQNVVDSLQSDIHMMEIGFDSREHRYEDVLSEYELGLSYLKDYHPTAYKDFHRIVGMRERYSHELEKENIKHLKL
jgi:hypothetical protein